MSRPAPWSRCRTGRRRRRGRCRGSPGCCSVATRPPERWRPCPGKAPGAVSTRRCTGTDDAGALPSLPGWGFSSGGPTPSPSLRSGTPPAKPGEKSGTRRRYLPPTCGWGTCPRPPRSARVLPQQSRGRNPGLTGGTFPQPAVGGLSRSRTTVKGMPYRLIYIGLRLLGAAALIIGIVFAKDGDPTDLPGALVSVSPEPNELVPTQAVLEVVLPAGYRAEIWVDGWPITDFTFVEATGVHRWSPSPGHPTIQTWSSGEHRVRIEWDTYSGLPDPDEWEWTFRVG